MAATNLQDGEESGKAIMKRTLITNVVHALWQSVKRFLRYRHLRRVPAEGYDGGFRRFKGGG